MAKNKSADLNLEYPESNEKVNLGWYTFRIASNVTGPVEVSIDDGPWMPCRESVGLWWFDYCCELPGKHKVVARVTNELGMVSKTAARSFSVESPVCETAPKMDLGMKAAPRPKLSANGKGRKPALRA
ncbi:MAG TPA: hypothetical protein DD417_02850 [Elusimicrobia bacterium]|nr:hypothetical protein [Elusimicrobiota bacterium]